MLSELQFKILISMTENVTVKGPFSSLSIRAHDISISEFG